MNGRRAEEDTDERQIFRAGRLLLAMKPHGDLTWVFIDTQRCLCNCSYYPLKRVKSQVVCLKGISSTAS